MGNNRETGAGASSTSWDRLWQGREVEGFGVEDFLPKHRLAAVLLERLKSRRPIRTVCDFGCGSGILLSHLNRRLPDLELCGADFVSFSQRRIEELGLRYIHFDLESDELIESLDVGILVDVLEHFHDPRAVLRRLQNLRYLIAVVPNFSFLTERLTALGGGVPFQWRNRLHATWFNVSRVDALVEGYAVLDRMETYPSKLSWLPFKRRCANLLATSFGVVLALGENRNPREMTEGGA